MAATSPTRWAPTIGPSRRRTLVTFEGEQLDKLNRLDEAFLFERSIDIVTYDRHAEKLREELTLDLRPIEGGDEGVVDQNSASWNRMAYWLGQIQHLQEAARGSWAGMLAR